MRKLNAKCIYPDWPAPDNVRGFTTTRGGGVSSGCWSSFNLGDHCGDDPADVKSNRAMLDALLPSPANWLRQVHGTQALKIPGKQETIPQGDALVTVTPGQVCAVLTADCLPVFLCNRRGDRVGVAHAGWRGLANGILPAAVRAMDEDPGELLAWLGPAIGPQAYEVGPDVAAAFAGEFPAGFLARGDRFLMDIYALARLKLAAAGVRSVYGGGFCTFTESTRFFSYRRDGVTGRMASLIWFDRGPEDQFAGA
ncbi:MAG: peptidoglycan editing factor PgeF [Xanthomonadales bacterium]|nr:peptidoglycan editing factor PgeF [Gammaproteobacteria bacterium]MBT8053079.1 peptidoglycan editing factor PgeF [Gammaproteobacteria bacterium]NND56677.1 peptidoglycan editing factor PgeF [Xanthomonadales bacterium]NNK52662.1 peptidoglycan editing factor PgeF [Xanthomonadales bacterium]